MRRLVRLLIFWAISAPLFYAFGLPYMLDMLSKKAQKQGYEQCTTKLQAEGTMGSDNSALNEVQGEKYCHCVSDGLIFVKADVMDMVRKKPPTALTALGQSLADACTHDLQQTLGLLPPSGTPNTNVINF